MFADNQQTNGGWIVEKRELCLVTGAAGFIGSKVFDRLLETGFVNIRCFVRGPESLAKLRSRINLDVRAKTVEIFQGNLLSRDDCARATEGVRIIFHLAPGRGEK